MTLRVFSLGLLLAATLFNCSSTVLASKTVPKDIRYLLGMYYGNASVFLVRENKGNLEIVYHSVPEDRDFSFSNIFPLQKVRFDSYTLKEEGPILSAEASVHFERDADGNGIVCKIGGKRFARNFFPGEGNKVFKVDVSGDYKTLLEAARQANVPSNQNLPSPL